MFLRELYDIDIIEARSKPGMNPKVSAYEKLLPYKDDPEIYITFTHLNKAGINPRSSFNTPNGIYTFPLALTWQMYEVDDYQNFTQYPEFIQGRPYIQVLRYTGHGRKLVISSNPFISDYTDEDLKKDLAKLQKLYHLDDEQAADLMRSANVYHYGYSYGEKEMPREGPASLIWTITRSIAYNQLNKRKRANVKYQNYETNDEENEKNDRVTNDWSSVLRSLGFQLIVDEFHSVIHQSEPCQAVFLSKKAFKHVDTALVTRTQERHIKTKRIDMNKVIDYVNRNGRDPKVEEYIVKHAHLQEVYGYWKNVTNLERWPALESLLLNPKDARDKMMFNDYVLEVTERCPELEPEILKRMPFQHSRYACDYVINNVRDRWEDAEPEILKSKNITLLVNYTINAYKQRWPEAEHAMVKALGDDIFEGIHDGAQQLIKYATHFGINSWPELEKNLLSRFGRRDMPKIFKDYALQVLKHRWPDAEKIIQSDIPSWREYASAFPEAIGIGQNEMDEFNTWVEKFKASGGALINTLSREQVTPTVFSAYIATLHRPNIQLLSLRVLDLAYNNPAITKLIFDAFQKTSTPYTMDQLHARIENAHTTLVADNDSK